MWYQVRQYLRDEEGATLVEYALVLMLIGVVCIGAVLAIGEITEDKYGDFIAKWP